jgi:hypothetical protein
MRAGDWLGPVIGYPHQDDLREVDFAEATGSVRSRRNRYRSFDRVNQFWIASTRMSTARARRAAVQLRPIERAETAIRRIRSND